jgi:hypothetical protein
MSNTFVTPRVVTVLSQSRLDYNNALTSLLQNFASSGQPDPLSIDIDGSTGLRTGMLWFKSGADTTDGQGRLFIYNGSAFTRNGIVTYTMPSVSAANAAAVAGKIGYGDLVLVNNDFLYMVNAANNGVVLVGGDAITLSGLVPSQFVRSDIDANVAGNVNFTSNAFIRVPLGNTDQRPGTSTVGMLRYNTTLNSFEGYDGVEWGEIGGGGAFTNDGTYVFYAGSANVGVGTNTPSANLHVAGTGNILKLETGTTSDTTGVTLQLSQNSTAIATNSGYGGVEWRGSDTGGSGIRGYLKGYAAGDSGEFSVRIATQGSGASSPVDRFSIWSSGNVGLGVLHANTTLQVAGNISVSGGDATIFNRGANYLALGTNNQESLRITPTGNIAYGTTTPSTNVQFNGTGALFKLQTASTSDSNGVTQRFHQTDTTITLNQGYGGIEWEGNDSDGSGVRGYVKGFAEGSLGEFGVRIATQGTGASSPVDRLTVNASGSVGIGTVNPSSALDVVGTIKSTSAIVNSVDVLANDYTTFTTLEANIYNTFITLNANLGVGGGSSNVTSQTIYTITTSNNYTLQSNVSDANNILVSFSGIVQIPWVSYTVYGNTTLRLNNTSPLANNVALEVRFL